MGVCVCVFVFFCSQNEREEFETEYKQKYERERILLTEENKKLSSELDKVQYVFLCLTEVIMNAYETAFIFTLL